MKLIYQTKVTRLSAKKNISYPMIRLPKDYGDMIGKIVRIYEVDSSHFLIEVIKPDSAESSFKKTKSKSIRVNKRDNGNQMPEKSKNPKGCGGPDSNRRTPTGTDLESVAFDLARQPPHNSALRSSIKNFLVSPQKNLNRLAGLSASAGR